jgi:DNA-binding CsgD family transcriptional regulator
MTKTHQVSILVTILFASVTIINCNKQTPLVYEERVVVTNRAAGTLTYIDPATDQVLQTQTMAGSEPMYIIYLPLKDRLLVGDRLQSKIHVINPATQTIETSIAVGSGVMHMAVDAQAKQLWAAGDLSNTLTVINLNTYTARENEVLQHLAKGLLYKEIAEKLSIATGTVRQHIHKIYEKLHVQNRTEALNKVSGKS